MAVTTPRDRLIAGYAALAVAINVLEAGFPSPLPGVKPGLANVITLLVLLRHGWRAAVAVTFLRVVVASLVTGSFLGPGFWLACAGAAAALAALALGAGWNRMTAGLGGQWTLSPLGLSALAALAHTGGQFLLARGLLIPHPGLVRLLPPLLLISLAFGVATGLAAQATLTELAAPRTPDGGGR
jgi:heptaprenyl diphosphate synthase